MACGATEAPLERTLVWGDEFDYTGAPDPEKWDYDLGDGCPRICGWGNNELEYYTREPENVRVENGSLIIEAHQGEKGGKAYTSARIVSRGKAAWKYGRVEVRAKIPGGLGTWAAIWMMPEDNHYGHWPKSGEIDIMEHVGYAPDQVLGTVHTEAYNGMIGTQVGDTIFDASAEQDFHVYTLDWTHNRIVVSMNDQPYFTFSQKPGADYKAWPFNQPFHLIMNLAVGGNWGGRHGVADDIWPRRMEVDYVRVYQ